MPTDALEEWRYSRIGDLDLAKFSPLDSAEVGSTGAAGHVAEGVVPRLVAALGPQAIVVHTFDGRLAGGAHAPGLDVHDAAGDGVSDGEPWSRFRDPDPYATLNRAFAPSWLTIAAAEKSTSPVVAIVHHVGAGPRAVFPRILIDVAPLAELRVVEILAGASGGFVAPVTCLKVAAGARLAYTQIQLLATDAWQIASQSSTVGRDATLVSAAVALGGTYARLRNESTLEAQGANGRLLALYFGGDSQMHDFRTVQHHSAPKTQSDLLFKGVVANESHSVYTGLIRVDKGAGGTNAMQTNRNLVLNEGAHADSVPNLEIEDNDVRCSHASAVGPIADDQRFYLESRGVPSDVAERLIALGFMDELLEQLPAQGLRLPLRALLAEKLSMVERREVGTRG